jgi:hypothetical protein
MAAPSYPATGARRTGGLRPSWYGLRMGWDTLGAGASPPWTPRAPLSRLFFSSKLLKNSPDGCTIISGNRRSADGRPAGYGFRTVYGHALLVSLMSLVSLALPGAAQRGDWSLALPGAAQRGDWEWLKPSRGTWRPGVACIEFSKGRSCPLCPSCPSCYLTRLNAAIGSGPSNSGALGFLAPWRCMLGVQPRPSRAPRVPRVPGAAQRGDLELSG